MSKLLANTLVILCSRVRNAEETAKTEKYFRDDAVKMEAVLRSEISAKDMEIRSLKKSLDERAIQYKSLSFNVAFAVQELSKKKKLTPLDKKALNYLKQCEL